MQKGMVRSNGKKFPFQIPEEQGIFPCNALLFKTYGYQLIQYDKAKFAGYSIDATCKICFGILYGCPNNIVWNFFTVTVRGKTMKANYSTTTICTRIREMKGLPCQFCSHPFWTAWRHGFYAIHWMINCELDILCVPWHLWRYAVPNWMFWNGRGQNWQDALKFSKCIDHFPILSINQI